MLDAEKESYQTFCLRAFAALSVDLPYGTFGKCQGPSHLSGKPLFFRLLDSPDFCPKSQNFSRNGSKNFLLWKRRLIETIRVFFQPKPIVPFSIIFVIRPALVRDH